jgi:cytochrome c oxidase cbb3-type subunit 3
MTKKQDELLNSNYDGIQEYDNDLPKWWQALFLITIVFAVIYSIYYFTGMSPSSEARLAGEMKAIEATQKSAPSVEVSAATLLSYVHDTTHLSAGKVVFQQKCLPCHGPEGQGIVGPNLTDDFWIHGGKITDIRHTIVVGVPEKGMLTWKGILSDDEINNVAAFVYSLHGSNPANPKAPQGDKVTDRAE